jgi:hypothetical protein
MQISGGVLAFDRDTAEAFIESSMNRPSAAGNEPVTSSGKRQKLFS